MADLGLRKLEFSRVLAKSLSPKPFSEHSGRSSIEKVVPRLVLESIGNAKQVCKRDSSGLTPQQLTRL